MRKLGLAFLITLLNLSITFSQGVNIPSSGWGLSFGNSTRFNGIRFNIVDKDIEKINGINISFWGIKESSRQTGTVNGISIGLPAAWGTEYRNGINIGLVGVGAKKDIKGINLGLHGTGAGRNAIGVNFGALGTGAGENLVGLNLGGLGVGAGETLGGINVGGLGVGAGEHLKGISIAGLGTGAPKMTGLQVSLVSGGEQVRGTTIAPAYFRIENENASYMKGLSVSAFNHIMGDQFGVAIGIFNYAWSVRGFQLGLLNHVKNNPKGLRWLPIFNTSF